MTGITFNESNMTFGPFKNEDIFRIEKCKTYQSIQQDVKISEFLLIHNKKLHIVEAKSSSPHPTNEVDFDEFINEIYSKFHNSVILFLALRHDRHQVKSDLSKKFLKLDLSNTSFCLTLIIHDHKEEWLPPIQEELNTLITPLINAWASQKTQLVVINDLIAREHGLIA